MGPAQSLFQAPLLILSWIGLVVLPFALARTRQGGHETWLGVTTLWGGVGALQLLISLSDRGQFAGVGALVLGLALLVGLHRVLWRPRQVGLEELRRVATLAPASFFLAAAAAAGTEEALGWSELGGLRRTFELGLTQLPLLVSPRVALIVTYFGVWCLATWALPEPWRIAREELESEPPAALVSESAKTSLEEESARSPASEACREGPPSPFASGSPNRVSESNEEGAQGPSVD